MKKFSLKPMLLLCALMVGVGSAGAADKTKWIKTAPNDLVDGDIVVIMDSTTTCTMRNDAETDAVPGATKVTLNDGKDQISVDEGNKDGSKVFLNFDVDETTYSQKDLLVATQSDTYTHSRGNIGFQFNHACGAVRFSLSKTSGLADYDVRVKSVKIYNIPCSGTYCFDDGTWAIESDSQYNKLFTLKSYGNDYLTVTSEKQFLSNDGDYLFLLPQTLTAWDKTGAPANAYVEIACKVSRDGQFKVGSASDWGTAYLPLGITIEKGKINPVNISLGTALRNAQGGKIF